MIGDYHAGVWIKIKLFCGLTKDWDKILISISTIQEFPAVDEMTKAKIVTKKDATCYGIAKYLPMTIHVSWSVEGQILLKKLSNYFLKQNKLQFIIYMKHWMRDFKFRSSEIQKSINVKNSEFGSL